MDSFIAELNQINNVEKLKSKKAEIKDQIIDKQLDWKKRIALYKKVQIINERIAELEK